MSGKTITRFVVTCDGCGDVRGEAGEYGNAIEARGALYAEGWRFPAKELMSGKRSSQRASDVCPKCLPGWKPQRGVDTWKNRRPAGADQ